MIARSRGAGRAAWALVVALATVASAPGWERALASPPGEPAPLYRSRDWGTTWTAVATPLPPDFIPAFLEPWGGFLVIASENHGLWVTDLATGEWTDIGAPLPERKITALHVSGDTLWVALPRTGLFASPDSGRTWEPRSGDLSDRRVRAILVDGDALLVGTDTGIFRRSVDRPWRRVFGEGQFTSLRRAGPLLVAGGARGTAQSRDGGDSWTWLRAGAASHNTAVIDGRIVLMDIGGDLLLSKSAGRSWRKARYAPRERAYVYEVVGRGRRLVASNSYGIHRSEDGGATWRLVHATEERVLVDLAISGEILYGGAKAWGEYRPKSR